MTIAEKHISPDGILRLIVVREEDGDVAIGFDGLSWHTHGDILAALSGQSEDQAVRLFVDSLIGDDQIIAVLRVADKIVDARPTEDPDAELKYVQPEESFEFRRWSGVTP